MIEQKNTTELNGFVYNKSNFKELITFRIDKKYCNWLRELNNIKTKLHHYLNNFLTLYLSFIQTNYHNISIISFRLETIYFVIKMTKGNLTTVEVKDLFEKERNNIDIFKFLMSFYGEDKINKEWENWAKKEVEKHVFKDLFKKYYSDINLTLKDNNNKFIDKQSLYEGSCFAKTENNLVKIKVN